MTALAVARGGLPAGIGDLTVAEVEALLIRTNPGVWAEKKRGFQNAPLHWEWYRHMTRERRLAVVAPREHAKTECFTVNATAWRSIYQPGTWTYVFAQSKDQGMEMKARIDSAVEEDRPDLVANAKVLTKSETKYSNHSRVTVAGAGKAVRGAHPDIIIGDDVMEESTSMTREHRDKMSRWWKGTIGGMAHPGTTRVFAGNKRIVMPATRVFLVGTPFHDSDLLMSMKSNPIYRFRRYAAEFRDGDLVDGLAVDVA